MQSIDVIIRALPAALADRLRADAEDLLELRLRAGSRAQLVFRQRSELYGDPLDVSELARIAGALMDFSLYAWENELAQGFFTLEGGCRVGVCGRYALQAGRPSALTQLQSLCIRVAREVRGCADPLADKLTADGSLKSLLIVSRPGMGKTTCLRDLARALSARGHNVALADERGELAALRNGVPLLDVGERTDVTDMCPKHIAISRMVRAMAPDVIITDEIGGPHDAEAVLDARRSGVAVIASAHADSIDRAFCRPALRDMREAFDLAALLAGGPGCIAEIRGLHKSPKELVET